MSDDTIVLGCSLDDCPEVEVPTGVQSMTCPHCGECVSCATGFARENARTHDVAADAIAAIPAPKERA